jgi:hypothetical protein
MYTVCRARMAPPPHPLPLRYLSPFVSIRPAGRHVRPAGPRRATTFWWAPGGSSLHATEERSVPLICS